MLGNSKSDIRTKNINIDDNGMYNRFPLKTESVKIVTKKTFAAVPFTILLFSRYKKTM